MTTPVTKTSLVISDKAKHYQKKSKAAGTLAVYQSALSDFLEGISREKGTRPTPKAPATLEVIKAMIEQLPDTLAGTRDRAILLLGFGGMFRRSELVSLTMDDVTLTGDHLTILIRHGKTDQAGRGLEKHFQMLENRTWCPVRALQAWLAQAGIQRGPVFRSVDRWGKVRDTRLSTESIAQIVKHAALGAGLDPAMFAGHSLRRGGITSALTHQAEERNVMLQTGHTDPKTLRHYNDDSGQGATLAARAAFGE